MTAVAYLVAGCIHVGVAVVFFVAGMWFFQCLAALGRLFRRSSFQRRRRFFRTMPSWEVARFISHGGFYM